MTPNENQATLPVTVGGIEYLPASLVSEATRQVEELRGQVAQLVMNLDRMVTERSVAKLRELLDGLEPKQQPDPMPEPAPEAEKAAVVLRGDKANRALSAARQFESQTLEGRRDAYTFENIAFLAGCDYSVAYRAITEAMSCGESFSGLKARKYNVINPAKRTGTGGLTWKVATPNQLRIRNACMELERKVRLGEIQGYTFNDVAELAGVSHGGAWTYIRQQAAATGNKLKGLVLTKVFKKGWKKYD